jgi:lysozyme family protein
MSSSSYGVALALAHEGGYTDDPRDPGGPTRYGITIADYRRYAKPDATAADVAAMPLADAEAVYRAHYWTPLRCDDLPPGLDYAVFDYGVNSGISRAARSLQRIAGADDDGIVGAATLAAVRAIPAAALIASLCDGRLRFLQSLRTWPVFGRGWGRRVAEVKAAATAMANQATEA